MNTRIVMGAVALYAAMTTSAWAVDPAQLAKDSGCLTCHSITEKVVGPSYKSVAEKYKGQPDAVASLVQSVRNGSKGTWGRIPMPAHPNLPEEDVRTLVKWVLSQSPAK